MTNVTPVQPPLFSLNPDIPECKNYGEVSGNTAEPSRLSTRATELLDLVQTFSWADIEPNAPQHTIGSDSLFELPPVEERTLTIYTSSHGDHEFVEVRITWDTSGQIPTLAHLLARRRQYQRHDGKLVEYFAIIDLHNQRAARGKVGNPTEGFVPRDGSWRTWENDPSGVTEVFSSFERILQETPWLERHPF